MIDVTPARWAPYLPSVLPHRAAFLPVTHAAQHPEERIHPESVRRLTPAAKKPRPPICLTDNTVHIPWT